MSARLLPVLAKFFRHAGKAPRAIERVGVNNPIMTDFTIGAGGSLALNQMQNNDLPPSVAAAQAILTGAGTAFFGNKIYRDRDLFHRYSHLRGHSVRNLAPLTGFYRAVFPLPATVGLHKTAPRLYNFTTNSEGITDVIGADYVNHALDSGKSDFTLTDYLQSVLARTLIAPAKDAAKETIDSTIDEHIKPILPAVAGSSIGLVGGGALGMGAGALTGRGLARLLAPVQYSKEGERLAKGQTLRTILPLLGTYGGTILGAHLGMQYAAPHIENKLNTVLTN